MGALVVPYPLMDTGGFAMPATGNLTGCVSVVRDTRMASRSEWLLILDHWAVFEPYAGPFLHYDRTAANHEQVKWSVADITFLVIDEDNAVLLYTVDGTEYIAWSTAHTVAACYGGTDKWWVGGL